MLLLTLDEVMLFTGLDRETTLFTLAELVEDGLVSRATCDVTGEPLWSLTDAAQPETPDA